MIKISPSILSADFANLERDIQRIDSADYVHVDVMDGLFVPNISIGIPVVQSIRPVTELPLDVHLMIDRPVRYVEQFCDAGADLVTVHVEADTEENIHAGHLDQIHAKGKRAGVVRQAQDPRRGGPPLPGRGGADPGDDGGAGLRRPEVHGRHDAQGAPPSAAGSTQHRPGCELEVDGGVDPDTCKICIAAGANVLVAGSAVYKAEDIPARIAQLRG